ncbi:ceruloplasmin-like [Gastrophryne carolinensis]
MKTLVASFLLLLYVLCVAGHDTEYFIGIQEMNWDYAPNGKNIISGKPIDKDEHASVFLRRDSKRIGRIYKKACYVQFTDNSYTKKVKKPEWLGFLGPILRAEVGDTLTVHLKNLASRPYSMHPHGTEYTKSNEGALYPDKTSGTQKKDDYVKPGESHTYKWDVVEDQGPSKWDDDCITRIYHSHVDGPKDVYSGLVGPMLICKKGVLNSRNEGVKKEATEENPEEYFLMLSVMDENLSWYIDENINTYTNPKLVDKEDEGFQESNKMHSINGYMYGNLPGISICDYTHVKWYMFSMGNEVDIHSAYFHGQTLTYHYHRVDTISLFPASMVQASMVTQYPGKWLLSCQVNDHIEGGMQGIYEVRNCSGRSPWQSSAKVREYFITAEEIIWNYGPTSINQFTGKKLDEPDSDSATFFEKSDNRIGGSYKKVVYREYTDSTFTEERPRDRTEQHLGILGPIIVAEVGDVIKITFKNKASRPYSIQAHGLSYTKNMEGAAYKTGSESNGQKRRSHASHVAPGDTMTYILEVPYSVGTERLDLNCLPWLYYSSVDVVRDTNSGLVGPLLVCRNLTDQVNIAHNFFLMPVVFDENKSWYIKHNIKQFTGKPKSVNTEDADFQESNMMHSINGYMYGNQPGLDMCLGEQVRWHMLGLGTEVDIHGIHFSGNTIGVRDTVRDVASVFPHIAYSVTMNPDNEGVFDVECMTTDHYTGGMRQRYTVKLCSREIRKLEIFNVKTYYIAAEEIEWDYSPSRTWEYEWLSHHAESPADVFLNKSRTSIGSKYKKVVYRQYTDKSFTTRKERTTNEEHLEILGPLIIAQVGDEIKIVFKNKASRPYSINAHGIILANKEVKATEPGKVETYSWLIRERSGPTHKEECLTWAYYSSVDPVKDTFSGLIGPLVICKKTVLSMLVKPRKHFALLFMVFDENKSWYLDENIQNYCSHPGEVNKEDDDFNESNMMHAINGKMYSNLQGLTMQVGDTVHFHLIGMGNEVDLHTVHFHAHSFEYSKFYVYNNDVFDLHPGAFQTVTLTAKNPGTWLLHCHVADHIHAGMVALYTVKEAVKEKGPTTIDFQINKLYLNSYLPPQNQGWVPDFDVVAYNRKGHGDLGRVLDIICFFKL